MCKEGAKALQPAACVRARGLATQPIAVLRSRTCHRRRRRPAPRPRTPPRGSAAPAGCGSCECAPAAAGLGGAGWRGGGRCGRGVGARVLARRARHHSGCGSAPEPARRCQRISMVPFLLPSAVQGRPITHPRARRARRARQPSPPPAPELILLLNTNESFLVGSNPHSGGDLRKLTISASLAASRVCRA